MRQWHSVFVGSVSSLIFAAAVTAQPDFKVAASVNDHRIYVHQVQWLMDRKFGDRRLNDKLAARLKAEVLVQLVNQLVVLDYLRGTDDVATDEEIRLAAEQIAEEAKRVDKTLKQVLEEQKLTDYGFHENLKWQISWKRYTDRMLTNENLEKYFLQNRRKYDGTEIQVAHLLIKVDDASDKSQASKAMEVALSLREKLLAGELSWSDAVEMHSQAATRNDGGEIGWIKIDGPMPINFTESAFELDVDEISPPVQTNFGMHLIRCLSVKPGGINWYDAGPELKRDATRFLFQRIVEDQRPNVSIRISGDWPYVDPDSGTLTAEKSGDRPDKNE